MLARLNRSYLIMARTFDVVSSRLDDPGESKSKESAKYKSNILFLFNKIDQSNWEVIADQERKIRFSPGKGIYSMHLTVLYAVVH